MKHSEILREARKLIEGLPKECVASNNYLGSALILINHVIEQYESTGR